MSMVRHLRQSDTSIEGFSGFEETSVDMSMLRDLGHADISIVEVAGEWFERKEEELVIQPYYSFITPPLVNSTMLEMVSEYAVSDGGWRGGSGAMLLTKYSGSRAVYLMF